VKLVGLAIKCSSCGAASVSSLFYRGPDAHACRNCGAPFELLDPSRDRREGADRRGNGSRPGSAAEWRSGDERRQSLVAA
jgi:hypothetical protein